MSLDSWYRLLTFLAIGLPIIGGICGFVAFMVSNRISDLQAVALRHAQDTAAEAKEVAMPRYLKDDQKHRFTETLLGESGHNVVVVSAMLDPEARKFADEFVEPFKNGKWVVGSRVVNWGRRKDGVTIARVDDKKLPGEDTLSDALTSANIKHDIKQVTGDDIHAISPWFTQGTLYLLIGSKPRAEIR